MYFDITHEDVEEARRLCATTLSHTFHNPIAIALERRYGQRSAVVTFTHAHVHGKGLIGRFELTAVARDYLRAFRAGVVWPVERLHVFNFQLPRTR